MHLLQEAQIAPVIIGAFSTEIVQMLKEAGSTYPVAGLVPVGADPHVHAKDADIIHLCWERMAAPQDTLTPELFARAFRDGKEVVSVARRGPRPDGGHPHQTRDRHLLGYAGTGEPVSCAVGLSFRYCLSSRRQFDCP